MYRKTPIALPLSNPAAKIDSFAVCFVKGKASPCMGPLTKRARNQVNAA